MATEVEWNMAYNHVKEALENNLEFIGQPGVEPCLAIHRIHIMLVKYNMNKRTVELYNEMINCE